MPVGEKKWDSNAERDLCLAIILGNQEGERARHNWPKVHSIMGNLGHGFTKDAISQHFTKTIMREFKARHGVDGNPSTAASSSPATPRKPRAPRSSPVSASAAKTPKSASMRRALLKKEGGGGGGGGSATKRSRPGDNSDDDDDDDDDDDEKVKAEMETPTKKVKTEAATVVKTERTAPRRGANVNVSFSEDESSFEKWVNDHI